MTQFFTKLSGPQRLGAIGVLFICLGMLSSCAFLSPSPQVDSTYIDIESPHIDSPYINSPYIESPLVESPLDRVATDDRLQSSRAIASSHRTPTPPQIAAAQPLSPQQTPTLRAARIFSPLVTPTATGQRPADQVIVGVEKTAREREELFSLFNEPANGMGLAEQRIYLAISMAMSQTAFSNYLPLIAEEMRIDEAQVAESPPLDPTVPPTVPPLPTGPPPPTPTPLPTPDAVARMVKVPILMYHYLSVPPARAGVVRRDLSVAPDLFAAHLDSMLEAGYQTISLYDLTMHLTRGNPLPARPLIITFDDGYRDNYENAFPLLSERNMTATFFIAPDFIDRQRPEYMDWPMVRTMFVGGMSIEAHGLDHRSLREQNVSFLAWQALATIQAIERETGKRPRFVSYPAGQYDALTIEVFHNSHFWAGLTTSQGATHRSESMFELRRIRVRNTTQPAELIRLMELDW